jgi:hypothetical protein
MPQRTRLVRARSRWSATRAGPTSASRRSRRKRPTTAGSKLRARSRKRAVGHDRR